MRTRRYGFLVILTLTLILAFMFAPGLANLSYAQEAGAPTSGDGVVPIEYDGNVSCQYLGYPFGFKIEGNGPAVYTGNFPFDLSNGGLHTGGAPNDLNNSVTLSSSDGFYLNWASTLFLDAVIVKGGQDSNAYVYFPEDNADTHLASPDLSGGNLPQISHVEFCYDYDLSATKTATAGYTRTYTWEIAKSVTPDTHSGFAGATFSSDYDVNVVQTTADSDFTVSGEIIVVNPSPLTVNFSVTDMVGGTPATVSCPTTSLGPNASVTCSYSLSLAAKTDGTNTATITSSTYGVMSTTASQAYVFGEPTSVVGYPTVNVSDSVQGALGSAPGSTLFEYQRNFACSSDTSLYINGFYSYEVPNRAKIDETGQTSDAKVTVNCYAPVVTKTASASYDETHFWTIEKSVTPETQSGIVGDVLPWTWTVKVNETATEGNFAVSGVITVKNPAPMEMIVSVSDVLDDGSPVTVDCGGSTSLTIPAGESRTCSYSATPGGRTAMLNTATATINGVGFSGTAVVSFVKNVVGGTATVTDQELQLNQALTAGTGPWQFSGPGSYTCSTNAGDYGAGGSYSGSKMNTATVVASNGQTASDDATTAYVCYAPVVTKDAFASYDENHTWTLNKSVTPPSQSGIVGDLLPWTWIIDVSETAEESNFAVHGTIYVANPSPEDAMTVDVADGLDDGTMAIVDCGGGLTSLTIPAGQTGSCTYSAAPTYRTATLNTAAATLKGVSFFGTAPVNFIANVIDGSAILTDMQIGVNETLVGDGESEWSFVGDDSHTCSMDASKYGTTGSYGYIVDNTATLDLSVGQDLVANASTEYTCYAPVVTKDAFASYDEIHTWSIEKSVDPLWQSGFAGDILPWMWTVNVSESFVEENFAVTGSIYVYNPSPDEPMTVDVADKLSDETMATVDCGGGSTSLTVAAQATGTCTYSAVPTGRTATLNKAVAILSGVDFTGTAGVSFDKKVINGTATVTDGEIGLDKSLAISEGPWEFEGPGSHPCSTTSSDYAADGTYSGSVTNTALVTGSDGQTASAEDTTEYVCYLPAKAKVVKATTEGDDAIGEFPFKFELYDPSGVLVETKTLMAAGNVEFAAEIKTEGMWMVKEILPEGWISTSDLICQFTVGFPASAGKMYSCDFANTEMSRVDLLKLTNGVQNLAQVWSFALYEGPDGFGGTQVASNSTPPALVDFGLKNLSPLATYTLCELAVPAGWTSMWMVDTNGDGTGDATIVPYNPNATDTPPEDLGNRCVDIGFGTDLLLKPGTTMHFIVDNQMPGGAPRTPGYWKNWNNCTLGNQALTAAKNGGWEEGFWLLENVLDPNVGGGITWDDIQTDSLIVKIQSCEVAVDILDKRDVGTESIVGDGKKMASDPFYNLATHLLAAQLNFGAGACTTQEVLTKALAAETLLDQVNFTGNEYTSQGKKSTLGADANALASYLDAYNNGEFCGDKLGEPSPPVVSNNMPQAVADVPLLLLLPMLVR